MVLSFEPWRAIAPRFPVRVPAVTEPAGTPGDPAVGEVENLSRSGMLLRLAKTLAPGTALRVTLSLCRRAPIVMTGTVVWVRPRSRFPAWALGIRFGEELPGDLVAEIADEEHPPWAARSTNEGRH
jgi:hypothetical protein